MPFPGGQTGDIIARSIGEQLARKRGQPFIIENKTGAGGTLGTGYAARAQNDGYTLLLTSTGPFAIAPSLYSRLPYKPLEDFSAVADIAGTLQLHMAARDVRDGQLWRLPPFERPTLIDVYLVSNPKAQLSRAEQAFARVMQEVTAAKPIEARIYAVELSKPR